MKIAFGQPKPRIEDWRVLLNGRTAGAVWRCGGAYRVSVTSEQDAPTKEAAFKAARDQLRTLQRKAA